MKVLELDNVTINRDGKPAVRDVSLTLDSGDFLAIVGENGSGKSTLIKGILGLVDLSSGSVSFGSGVKRKEIGYLPQQAEIHKDFPARVDEVVISGCLASLGFRPFYSKLEKNIAEYNMERLGIKELKKYSYSDLSGGQQQRVLLARALCAAKSILLLDEPAAGLDPVISSEFYMLLNKLNKDDGITIIMVSHDIRAAVDNADKVLHMGTKVFFYGTSSEYMNSEIGRRFTECYGKYNY